MQCFVSTIKDFVPQFIGYKEDKLTHSSLCTLAANWIIRNHKCRAVLIERGCGSGEMPDVIGWYFDKSVVVEAKTSRADFFADAKKVHRTENPMGQYRYFICPKNMISVEEIPEKWGLLYVSEKGIIRLQKEALICDDRDKDREFLMLSSALASPWKLFQHWSDENLRRLANVNWMSKNMGIDIALFCKRIAVSRLEETP